MIKISPQKRRKYSAVFNEGINDLVLRKVGFLLKIPMIVHLNDQ